MNRIKICVFLMSLCLIPFTANASEKLGIYIAPKLIYGMQVMDSSFGGEVDFEDDVSPYVEPADIPLGGANKSASESVFGGSIAIGYSLKNLTSFPIRTELEYSYFSEKEMKYSGNIKPYTSSTSPPNTGTAGTAEPFDIKVKNSVSTLFLNVYYDFENSSSFTPYVGAGVGYGWSDASATINTTVADVPRSLSSSNGEMVWNIGLGCAYAINETLSIDLGYKYVQFGESEAGRGKTFNNGWEELEYSYDIDTSMHQISLGVRVTF